MRKSVTGLINYSTRSHHQRGRSWS